MNLEKQTDLQVPPN